MLVGRTAAPLPPGEHAVTRRLGELELTGRPVLCWTTIARCSTSPPETTAPILNRARSQPLSWLSMARSKRARSRKLCSRCRWKRAAPTCRGVSGGFEPTTRPLFQAGSWRRNPKWLVFSSCLVLVLHGRRAHRRGRRSVGALTTRARRADLQSKRPAVHPTERTAPIQNLVRCDFSDLDVPYASASRSADRSGSWRTGQPSDPND